VKETMDLKRFLKLPFVSQYLYNPGHPLLKLGDIP
jgi:Acylamino-acid-releasing enzyme, N-terminal domain